MAKFHFMEILEGTEHKEASKRQSSWPVSRKKNSRDDIKQKLYISRVQDP